MGKKIANSIGGGAIYIINDFHQKNYPNPCVISILFYILIVSLGSILFAPKYFV